jgi:cell division protein FtsL
VSATTGHAGAPRQAPRPHLQLPRLRAVAPVSRVPRLPFLLLTIAAIVAGVFGLVALNVSVNQQSFRISELQRQNRLAEARWTELQADVDRLKAPARIAKAAKAARLAPAGRPRVVALPGARGNDVATPGAVTSTSPAAPGAGLTQGDEPSGWTAGDPFPLKRYLAEP